jgi:hypothetical protein
MIMLAFEEGKDQRIGRITRLLLVCLGPRCKESKSIQTTHVSREVLPFLLLALRSTFFSL